jgi:putative mRNA 3-end processing factor
MDSVISLRKEGLYFAPGNFYLDPQEPVETAIVSHAHGDHFINGHKTVYCTEASSLLIEQRMRYYGKKVSYSFHKEFQVNNCSVSFIPAGHILGSAQVLIIFNGVRYLYTGDFKLVADKSCEPFEFTKADVLITESTFAHEGFRHPPYENEIKKINQYENINLIIGVYALGKAQRIVQLINEFCPGKKIMVHRQIGAFNKAYEKSGFSIGNWSPYDRHVFRRERNIIYLLPPAHSRSFYPQSWYLRAFASGWEHLQTGFDFNLYISDHADWFDLLTLIENSSARHIFTLHGKGDHLKKHLNAKGIEVTVLN